MYDLEQILCVSIFLFYYKMRVKGNSSNLYITDDKAYFITTFVPSQYTCVHTTEEEIIQYEGPINASLLLQLQKIFWNKFQLKYCTRLRKNEVYLISYSYVVSLISIKNLNFSWAGIWSILFTAVFPGYRRLPGMVYINNNYSEQNVPFLIHTVADSSVISCCFMHILLYN